jgi:hypothetical protein
MYQVRGDIARALLYMAVRYEGEEPGTKDLELSDQPSVGRSHPQLHSIPYFNPAADMLFPGGSNFWTRVWPILIFGPGCMARALKLFEYAFLGMWFQCFSNACKPRSLLSGDGFQTICGEVHKM